MTAAAPKIIRYDAVKFRLAASQLPHERLTLGSTFILSPEYFCRKSV